MDPLEQWSCGLFLKVSGHEFKYFWGPGIHHDDHDYGYCCGDSYKHYCLINLLLGPG